MTTDEDVVKCRPVNKAFSCKYPRKSKFTSALHSYFLSLLPSFILSLGPCIRKHILCVRTLDILCCFTLKMLLNLSDPVHPLKLEGYMRPVIFQTVSYGIMLLYPYTSGVHRKKKETGQPGCWTGGSCDVSHRLVCSELIMWVSVRVQLNTGFQP